MKRRELLKHLEERGCEFYREGKNHTLYWNPKTGRVAPIPRHREIKATTARTACDQLGVERIEQR